MPALLDKARELFLHAVGKLPPEEWDAYLVEACAGDPELQRHVQHLLQVHREAGSFLESPAVGPDLAQPTVAESPSLERPGEVIGPYKLLQVIGEGGMGVVYMAEQTAPVERRVALKIIKPGMDTRQVIARFEAERQALAMMDHPHIAKVLDAGTTASGRPYFVMELVKGVPITKYCDENHLTVRERLELFAPVCQAVQHAHQKGIIHRDLKPTNVLVAEYDQRAVPKVIDFGVAKATAQKLTEKTMFTELGQVVGTIEYMSPEQAKLNQLDIDTRSDVYSLGVLLYELLTGSTPFDRQRLRSSAFDEMLRIIREEEPPKPSTRLSSSATLASVAANRHIEPGRLSKLVRGELDWIVMKALEKDRNRRYETANGFAADVLRYLNDEAVQACPPSAVYKLRKFARRNKAALATVVVLAASLLSGIAATTWQAIRATKAESTANQEAENARQQEALAKQAASQEAQQRQVALTQGELAKRNEGLAKEQERLASRRYYSAQMNLAQQALEAGNIAMTLDLLETQRPAFDEEDLRTFEWYYLWQACHRGRRFTLQGWKGEARISASGGPTRCLAVSPDGRTLAAAGWDRHVRLWDLATARLRVTLEGHSSGVTCVAFSPDGESLASGSFDRTVILWDVDTHQVKTKLQGPSLIWSVAYAPDGKTLVTGSQDKTVRLWDLATGQPLTTLTGHKGSAMEVAFAPDGRTIVSGSWDGMVKVWDVASHAERFTLPGRNPVAFAPDGVLACGGGPLRFWDVHTGKERSTINAQRVSGTAVTCLDFSASGIVLASGHNDRNVALADLNSGQARAHHGRLTAIQCVTFSPDGQTLFSIADDGKIEVWDVSPESEPPLLKHSKVRSVVFSRDGRVMASASPQSAKVVEVATGRHIADIKINPSHGGAPCALSPDGKTLAAAGGDGIVRLLDAATGRELAALRGHKLQVGPVGQVYTVAFSPDGKTLASGSQDTTAILWDLASRQPRARLRHTAPCTTLAFSPDGQLLATGCQEGLTKIWDVSTGKERLILQGSHLGNHHWLWAAAFSPDGKMLATGGTSGAVKLWDAETGVMRATLKGHTGVVQSVAFLPDGQTLVTTDDDAAKFWDPATGQERITLKNINRVGVVSDGKTMALAATDGTVRFWHGAEDSEAQAYKSEFARDKALDPLVQVHAGDHLHASGRHEESAQSYRQALSRLEKLAAQNPQVAEYQAEQAYVYFALSLVLRAAGRSEEADQNQRKGLVIHRNLAAVHPDAPDLQSTPLDRLNELQWLLSTPAEADRRVKEFAQLVLAIHDAVPAAAVGKRNGLVLNNLAWRLATGKDPRARDPQRAVALAKKAVELDPENAAYANTLGVALYRSAEWQAAIAALEKALEMRNGGDSFDWFFLAMAHWRLGEKEEACQWFEQAALWMAKNNPDNEELKRFRDEAADLLRDEFKGLLETIEKTCRAEALAHSKRGNTQEKLAARRQAIDLLNELLAAGADAVRIRGMLAATLQSMGELQAGLEEFSDAESSLNDALRIRTELQGEQGDAPETLLDAVSTKVALGQLYWVSDRRSLAQTTWQECLSVLDQLAAASRTDARLLQARIAERPSAALFRQWLENQWAEADWQQRVQQAGDDPTPWIQRGRWRAERGEHEKADADFAKAASLTPNELNKFLESGWWVVGPYPQKLKEFCPPEIEPDPSQPVYVIDPQTGISDEPVRWQTLSASESVAGAQDGAVDLSEFFARNGGGSVYALGYVFSPDERSVTLFLNKNWPCRVWVNGAPTEAASADAVGWLTWTRVPVVLRPGRNTILVKTASQQFMALLSDEPAARAWELFKFGNFDRAAETYARVLQSPAHQWIVRHACFAALVAGDQEAYREFSKRLPSRSNAGLDAELGLLDAEVYANTEVPKADLPRLKSILERWYANPNRKREPWFERMSASSHYRLGEFDKVVAILKDFPNESHASPLLAMAYHRLGQKDQARKWLSRADALVDRSLKDFAGNGEGGLWLIYPTYREAVELIRGDAIELDARFHAFLAERQRLWETRDPLICAFDDGVRNAANDPHAYLARGKRLAELGRFDEAEADFNKAVELAPDDVETLAARARFQAQRGDAVKAQAEFAALLALATSRRDLLVTRFVEREIGQCETVLEYWRQREPTTAALGRIRAERLLRRGEWREAAAAFEETAEHAFREQFAAALYCLLNDRKAYEEACSRHAALAAANDPAAHEYGRLFILALWPGAPLEELTQLMEDRLPVEGEPFWRRFPVALAFYRHARYADAERELTQSLAGPAGWQAKARFWAVLAMTCWRTGRPAEARQWLRLCDWWTDFHRPGAEIPNDIAPYVNAHFEWLATHILYREAKALIEPRSPEESSPAPVHGPGPATPSIGP